MSDLRVFLLGAPLVERHSEAIHIGRRKSLALLAYLTVTGEAHRRDALAALLWPELDRARGLASLRRCLVSLSKIMGKHLESDRTTIGLRPGEGFWSDVGQFTAASKRLPGRASAGEAGLAEQLDELEAATRLYRDDFLAGFSLPDGDAFDDWQFSETERFRREHLRMLDALVAGHRARGDLGRAIEFAQKRLNADRLAEDVHRLLIRLYLESGERSEALRQYERCAAVLRDELEVEPEPATQALWDEIRGAAEGSSSIPVRRSAARPETGPVRVLPETQTPILGRETELNEISERLTNPACRLLTLVGPGGVGKTRLALEAAHLLEDRFEAGVCFVPLAPATPQSLLRSITDPLGLSLDPKGKPEIQLITFLGDRHLLLVLDNFEHLAQEAELVARILSHAPNLRVLVTSRERLNLQGEWLFEVGGLEFPEGPAESRAPESFGAVQLFLQAARRSDPDFQLTPEVEPWVARICRLLVGMPLGIELAAAWLRLVSCREIAEEISHNIDFLSGSFRDLPERHRSLRAVFESSLRLLAPAERELLLALSEFQDGFSREAAVKVAQASLPMLAGLLDKSLLSVSAGGRYQLHELIRQFAAELLRSEKALWRRIQTRHSEYYLNLLAERAGDFGSERLPEVISELRREADNLQAAWSTAIRQRRFDLLEQSVDAYHQFHQLANRFGEGEERMGAAAAIISAEEQPLLWARTAARQGRFNNHLGRYRKAQRLLEGSLKILLELDVPREIAFTRTALSTVFFHLGDFRRAKELAAASVDFWRRLDEKQGLANALVQYGRTRGYSGEIDEAEAVLNEAYELFEGFGNDYGMARCLNNLANLTYLSGRRDEAIRLFELSMKKFQKLGDRRGLAFSISNLAVVMEDLGNHAEAKRMSQEALALFREMGYQEADSRTRGPAIPLENCGRACLGLGEYEEARDCFIAALETSVRIHQTPLILASLLGLAQWLIHEDRTGKAWEIVDLAEDHPGLSLEASHQLNDLRRQLEEIPSAQRPPKSAQLPSIRLQLLVDEFLAEHPVSTDSVSWSLSE